MTDLHYRSAETTSNAISYLTNQSAALRVCLTPCILIGHLTGLYNYSQSPDPFTGTYIYDTD